MSNRRRYLVSYDISDPKRLRQVFKTLHGFGTHLQYSVFQCDLSEVAKYGMLAQLQEQIHHGDDRVMVVDIGPVDSRAKIAFEFLGRAPEEPPDSSGPTIV